MPNDILRAEGLGFAYPGEPAIVTDWSTSIGAGVTLMVGDSGTGKSTLMRILAGGLPACGGRRIRDIEFARQPAAYRASLYWTEPDTTEFDAMSAAEYAGRLAALYPGFDAVAWRSHLDGFALRPHEAKPIYMLSTGSRRKVWLSAALATHCAVTLLDEPTAALDMASIHYLHQVLRSLTTSLDRAIVIGSYERDWPVPFAQIIDLPIR